jgi:hypothetical protein
MTTAKQLLLAMLCISVTLAAVAPPTALADGTLTLNPTSGPSGTSISVTGSGWTANTYYYLWFDNDGDGIRDSGEPYKSAKTTSSGSVSNTLTTPTVAGGSYNVCFDLSRDGIVDASAPYTVTGRISISPTSGYAGTVITVSGNGFVPGNSGYVWLDTNGDSVMDAGEPQAEVTILSDGKLPSGITLTVPVALPGTYNVRADIPTGDGIEASASFSYTPKIAISPTSGVSGKVIPITVTGGGFAPSTSGYIWFDTNGDSVRDTTEPQVAVTVTDTGAIPAGTTLDTPGTLEPSKTFWVRADIPPGTPIEASALFTTKATTTFVIITKYDAHGAIVNTQTVTWEWMRDNLPVYGDGITLYYCEGPNFDEARTFETLWDITEGPGDPVPGNIESRNYGAAMGTDFKDLCDLVGGASAGYTIKATAVDNWNRVFDYENIYTPDPRQGPIVLTWYTTGAVEGHAGYVGDGSYDTGMRILFFTPITDSIGRHVFGDYDEYLTWPENRYYFYYDSQFWPTTSGPSGKYIKKIDIYPPTMIECDADGNTKENFLPGETVYVKGQGLTASRNYNLWIQPEPAVWFASAQGNTVPGCTVPAPLSTANDPSGSQESVTTDASGDFSPVAIWTILPTASPMKYDIVADIQGAGTVGKFDTSDGADSPGFQGFAVVYPTITATAGANGMIDPSGDVEVVYGSDQTFAITPDPGYAIADVLVDGASAGTVTSYTFTNVVADHTIAASFEVTYASLGSLVEQVVTKEGIVNSLLAKLDNAEKANTATAKAGKIGAFINEVEAQAGKAQTDKCISPEDAARLIFLANQL